MVKYIPKRGDIVYVDLDPTLGHEQKGTRPAIVISNNFFNPFTNMVILCPISSNTKDFPTHYTLEDTKIIKGAVLCEHTRSMDYNARKMRFVEEASDNDLLSVMTLMFSCIE
jgi:mRNA interferase MazF